MVRSIIAWSLHDRLIVLLGVLGLIILGMNSAWTLDVEAYPDPTPPLVEVITQNPGASPEEMERLIGIPIETALNGMRSGLRLTCRCGETEDGSKGGKMKGDPPETEYTTFTWVYQWQTSAESSARSR